MTDTAHMSESLTRIEQLLAQLLLATQHQAMVSALIQDDLAALRQAHAAGESMRAAELAALRQAQAADLTRLEGAMVSVGQRADWFNVQFSDVLRVLLRELREVRATQVFAALSDGPISAQLLQDLVHQVPEDELLLELPSRPQR